MSRERQGAAAGGGSNGEYPALLEGGDATEILSRIAEGDPLHLTEAARKRIIEEAWLLDPQRLAARSLARIAFDAAVGLDRSRPFPAWLDGCLDRSIGELVEEDWGAELLGAATNDIGADRFYGELGQRLEVEPAFARRLTAVFNSFSAEYRRPFYEVVIRGRDLQEYACECDVPIDHLQARLLHVVMTLAEHFGPGGEGDA